MKQAALAALHAVVSDESQPGYVKSKAAAALLAADRPEPPPEDKPETGPDTASLRVVLPSNGRDAPPPFANIEIARASGFRVAVYDHPAAAAARQEHNARLARMRRRIAELLEELQGFEGAP